MRRTLLVATLSLVLMGFAACQGSIGTEVISPCNNTQTCGDCTKIKTQVTVSPQDLSVTAKIYCIECSKGFPSHSAEEMKISMFSPTPKDPNMGPYCSALPPAAVLAIVGIILLIILVVSIVCCKKCCCPAKQVPPPGNFYAQPNYYDPNQNMSYNNNSNVFK